MLTSPAALLLPFVLVIVLSPGVRLALGAERAVRFGGVVLPFVFLIAWGAIVRPGWFAYDAVGRIGHIVFGAGVVGLLCDAWLTRRPFLVIGAVVFVVISAWAEANGGLWPYGRPSLATLAVFLGTVAIALAVLWRIDRFARQDHPFMPPALAMLVVLLMLALAFAAVADAAGNAPLRLTALVLASALAGATVWAWITPPETLPHAVVLPAAGGLLAIVWALIEREPFTGPGLALAALILFADGTARRVPLPKAGISRILAPLVLAGVALAPLALAVALTVAVRGNAD